MPIIFYLFSQSKADVLASLKSNNFYSYDLKVVELTINGAETFRFFPLG